MYTYDYIPYRGEERFGGLLLPFVGGLLVGGLFAPGQGPLYPTPQQPYPPTSYPPMNYGPSMPNQGYYPQQQITYQTYNSGIIDGRIPEVPMLTGGYEMGYGMY